MSRPLRVVIIFLGLLLLLAVQAIWLLALPQALPVAGGLLSGLVVLLGLVFRGARPAFTRAERQRIFGQWVD